MKKTLHIVIFLMFAGILSAQQLPFSNQFTINPATLSPALTGHNNNYEAFLGYQRSWLGISGAPELKQFNLNGPIGEKMGIGGSILDDQVGIFRALHLSVNYAYHLRVSDESVVSFGTNVSLIDQQIASGMSSINDPTVIMAQSNQKTHFNLGVGINYAWKGLNAGISLPYALPNSTPTSDSNNAAAFTQNTHYRLYGSYLFNLRSEWSIQPTLVVNTTFDQTLVDFAGLVSYRHLAWLGAGYQSSGTVNLHVGGLPLQFLVVQYSYGIGSSAVMAESSGNHEITLGLLIGRNDNSSSSIFQRKAVEKKKDYFKWVDD